MSAMAANMRVATPVQIAVGREKPAEKEPSGGDDRFSNLLSQRKPHDDAPPAHHVAPSKSKTSEPAKQKDDKPDDTLHLLQTSTAIQAGVTPPTQTDPASPTQTAVDDVLAKSAAASAPQPLVNTTVANRTSVAPDALATTTTTTDNPRQAVPFDNATTQFVRLLQSTSAEKPVVDSTAAKSPATATVAVSIDQKKNAVATQSAVLRTFEPATPANADASPPQADKTASGAQPSIGSLPTNVASQSDIPPANVQAAQPMNVAQQSATPAAQLDFSNAAPILIASVVAAAAAPQSALRDDPKDDTLTPVDSTSRTGAIPSFTLPAHRDIATVDGKVPVPAPSSPQFGDALGAKLSWMAERHIGHAEIRLSPDDLGTIDVRVRLNGEHVRAEFNSANTDVRQAINTHLPRLRDMLSQHGFNLAESHVGNGSNQSAAQNTPSDSAAVPADDEVVLPTPRIPAYTHNGILDAFA